MVRLLLMLTCLFLQLASVSQPVPEKLQAAYRAFQDDPQMLHGIASLYVVDANTGKEIFKQNERLGMVPASTQKVITSITAYELLGPDFRYQTKLSFQQKKEGAEILVLPSGDPSFGSWRWQSTGHNAVLRSISQAAAKAGIKMISSVSIDNSGWNAETIPDGWIWQDIGNYYGAGASKLNWHENQYDVVLQSGKQIGSPVSIVSVTPEMYGYQLHSEVKAAASNSGDSAYIYFPLQGSTATIRGTIPVSRTAFKISGAMPAPLNQFVNTLRDNLTAANIKVSDKSWKQNNEKTALQPFTVFYTHTSPNLDSLVYWLNRKSVNLYAEALLKTMAEKQNGTGSIGNGISVVQDFWKPKGISESELKMQDGSGLSPLNRNTSQAQVRILQYAQKQSWYSGFYNSLPTYNGMKMKSGTMQGVKAYCGYYRDKAGNEYVFSFMANNFSGTSAEITRKMYRVLDALK